MTAQQATLIDQHHPNAFYSMACQGIADKNLDGTYRTPEAFQCLTHNHPAIELDIKGGKRDYKVVAVSLDTYGRVGPFVTGVLSQEGHILAAQILEVAPTVDDAIVQMNEWQFALHTTAEA